MKAEEQHRASVLRQGLQLARAGDRRPEPPDVGHAVLGGVDLDQLQDHDRGFIEVALLDEAPTSRLEEVPRDSRSGETLVIPVRPEGGTLVVRYAESAATQGDPVWRTTLYHEGLLANALVLRSWAELNGAAQDERRFVIPRLEPGPYTACLDLPLREVPGIASAAEAGRCATGELTANGELTLEGAAGAAAAQE